MRHTGLVLLAAMALVVAPASARPQSSRARAEAQAIVAEKRFRASSFPRPLHGFFVAVGDLIRTVTRPLGRLVNSLGSRIPGGPVVVWSALGLLFAGLAGVAASSSVRRRTAGAAEAEERVRQAVGEGAAELERAADEAERAGDYARAVRLRFRAGLVRLDASRVIELRPSLTTHEVARRLASPRFDRLALTFEEVAYGGRGAAPEDAAEARAEWADVLRDAA